MSIDTGKTKGEKFRRYLDESGVTKTLSQILVMLYRQEEKPDDPLRYVKDKLMDDCDMDSCIGQLRSRITKATEERAAIQFNMQNLRDQNNTLRLAIDKLHTVIGSMEIQPEKEPNFSISRKSLVSSARLTSKRKVSTTDSIYTLNKSSSNFVTRFPEIMDN